VFLLFFASLIDFVASQNYGVDISFPVHHGISTNYAWLPHNTDPNQSYETDEYKDMPVQILGNRKDFYENFINGCRERYGKKEHACDETERDRMAMSVRQPQSMQNYTETGFKKIRAPESLRKLLTNYWEKNKEARKEEKWSTGNTYVNHWAAPTYMVNVEDSSLDGGGIHLKHQIWEATRPTIEKWTGMEQRPSSLYGIRIYTDGAVLAPHVDRIPLISSAIVNVAQDVDEDWPLEVFGWDGMAYNVTMKPGDMVLYESHSLIHGRVFPLRGRYYANIFIHFEPTGEALSQRKTKAGGTRGGSRLPSYILEGSPESAKWLREHTDQDIMQRGDSPAAAAVPASDAHHAATVGDYEALVDVAKDGERGVLTAKDSNGWEPIHEAARGGHKYVIELLVAHGANINERTHFGSGGTPLHWVKKAHGANHPLVEYLASLGAVDIGPDL